MKKIKLPLKHGIRRTVSVLLAVLMVVGIFTVLPLSVGAVEDETTEVTKATTSSTEESKPTAKSKGKISTGASTKSQTTGDAIASGTCGNNATWKITNDNDLYTLFIEGSGALSFSTQPWRQYQDEIRCIIIAGGITSICSKTFSGLTVNDLYVFGNPTFSETSGTELNRYSDWLSIYTYTNSQNVISFAQSNNYDLTTQSVKYEYDVYDEPSSSISYSFNNRTLTISGNGAIDDYNTGYDTPWYSLITDGYNYNIVIENGITSIGNHAFEYCGYCTNITLPNSVTSIGDYAFLGCNNLTSITIPNSVTSIGNHAFSYTGLSSLPTIPNNCTVSSTAFSNCRFGTCRNNVNYTINNGVLLLSGTGSLELPLDAETQYCPWYSFQNEITSIVINNGITSIENSTFSNSTNNYQNLTTVTIADSVQSIGRYAFRRLRNLTTVNIGQNSNLSTIYSRAFEDCYNLTIEPNIPQSAQISPFAFEGCPFFTNNTYHEAGDFATYEINNNTLNVIGEGSIYHFGANSMFSDSDNQQLNKVIIDEGITGIEDNTFEYCHNLKYVSISSSVNSIGRAAFYNSENAIISVPESVSNIGHYAFYNCDKVICPVNSYTYNVLTGNNFTKYRNSDVEIIGTVSSNQQFASVFSATGSPKSASSANKGSSKGNISTGGSAKNSTGADPVEEKLTEAEIAENLSHIRCYLVDDVEIDERVTFDTENDVVLHLNDFNVASDGDLIDGTPHTLEGSVNGTLIEVPGDLTIKTTGEGQGGISNDSGTLFDVKKGGSLTIENGNYSEDVSEYIADNKVMGKTGDTYTVVTPSIEDMTLENDGHQLIMPNNQDTFARNDFVGVQMRQASANVSEGMRFVSIVRSDLLRGAEDYGYVLVKGRSIDNMNANKSNIYVGSDGCKTVSLKGSKNTLANTAYSSANLNEGKYKYLTAAIKDIDDDSTAIGARFYIKRADGTYVYADYTCCATMGMLKAA